MSREAYISGRVKQARHNSNREFITLIACISVIGKKVPVALLYTSKLYDLRSTWIKDLEAKDNFFFSTLSNK
jgi:hypothetical protein